MQAQHTHTRTMNGGAALATTLFIYLFIYFSFPSFFLSFLMKKLKDEGSAGKMLWQLFIRYLLYCDICPERLQEIAFSPFVGDKTEV
jgi:hypothetical protein